MTTVEVFAPAKINLALHVVGQDAKGYHLLDSLVAFAGVGDRLTLKTDGPGGLIVTGPEAAHVPTDQSNLIHHVLEAFWTGAPLTVTLEKNLPVASGIGGGSADAAACYRALLYLMNDRAEGSEDAAMGRDAVPKLFEIGADVPMCAASAPTRAVGIGIPTGPISNFPELPILLVNPRVHLPTGDVFKNLAQKSNAFMASWPEGVSVKDGLFDWLALQRNDLEAPAIALAPSIADVLAALRPHARIARMSGSGATCFGLFDDPDACAAAAAEIRTQHPDWWLAETRLNGHRLSEPQVRKPAAEATAGE